MTMSTMSQGARTRMVLELRGKAAQLAQEAATEEDRSRATWLRSRAAHWMHRAKAAAKQHHGERT